VAAGAVARLVIPEVSIMAKPVEIGGSTEEADWERLLDEARQAGSSLGAVIQCIAIGAPAGWGAPVYAKLDAELAAALMSINAVKGVEIGAGFGAARGRGEDNADPAFAGGITGGIATGEAIVLRAAFKPTSSVAALGVGGRHDPCVGLRGAAVVEAMVALVLADHRLLHRAQCG
jgi:chorismate synthase